MSEPRYTAKEQRERMADFERQVKKARTSWRRGRAYVILSIEEYFDLKAAALLPPPQDAGDSNA